MNKEARKLNGRVKTVLHTLHDGQELTVSTDEGEFVFKVEGEDPDYKVLQRVELGLNHNNDVVYLRPRY